MMKAYMGNNSGNKNGKIYLRNTSKEKVTNVDNQLDTRSERKRGNENDFKVSKWKRVTNANNKDRDGRVCRLGEG